MVGGQSQGNYRGRTTSRADSMGRGEWENGPGDNDLEQSGPAFAGCPGAISAARQTPKPCRFRGSSSHSRDPAGCSCVTPRTSREAVTLHLSPLSGAGNE